MNEIIIDFVEAENSNLYLDDDTISQTGESDTLDEIEDDVLDDKDVAWDDTDSGHHSKQEDVLQTSEL